MQPRGIYFLDVSRAMAQATDNFQQVLAGGTAELVVFYTCGQLPDNAPLNLLSVPLGELPDFLFDSDLMPPAVLDVAGCGCSASQAVELQRTFSEVVAGIAAHRVRPSNAGAMALFSQDRYYLDRHVAWLAALQGNRMQLDGYIVDDRQLCYYDGEPIDEAPETLVHVPLDDFVEFFSSTRLRVPTQVYVPWHLGRETRKQLQQQYQAMVKRCYQRRKEHASVRAVQCKQIDPWQREPVERLRFFLPANRRTTVMQYCSMALARALEALGHEVYVSIEQTDLEYIDSSIIFQEYAAFKPDAVININNNNNVMLHDHVVNVIWWQDPMEAIVSGKKIQTRTLDIHLAESQGVAALLQRCGIEHPLFQRFCVDETEFYPEQTHPRERSIVFVGSSYQHCLADLSKDQRRLLDTLKDCFEHGELLDTRRLETLAADMGVEVGTMHRYPLSHVVRDVCVRALCEQDEIPFELYGYYWDYDPIFRCHYKGPLAHGRELAAVYARVKYALVCLPGEIQSQRMVEAAACGCVPIVYDSRHEKNTPHWENHCHFFRSRAELLACFRQPDPPSPPEEIAAANTYRAFAERIVRLVSAARG